MRMGCCCGHSALSHGDGERPSCTRCYCGVFHDGPEDLKRAWPDAACPTCAPRSPAEVENDG